MCVCLSAINLANERARTSAVNVKSKIVKKCCWLAKEQHSNSSNTKEQTASPVFSEMVQESGSRQCNCRISLVLL